MPISMVRAELGRRWTRENIDHRTGGPARYVRVPTCAVLAQNPS